MKIRSRWLTVAVGWIAAQLIRLLARTYRFEVIADEEGLDPSQTLAAPSIFSMWHDQIIPPLARHGLTRPKAAALVSRHQDGSYLAEFMSCYGIMPVRGSTSRGGDQAARELLQVPSSIPIFITPDGPRGPHHELKTGVIFLASRSGRCVVPVISTAPRAWYLRGSWTGLLVPKPFATVYFRVGTPLNVPANATREELDQYTQAFQVTLNSLEADLNRRLGIEDTRKPLTISQPQTSRQRRAA